MEVMELSPLQTQPGSAEHHCSVPGLPSPTTESSGYRGLWIFTSSKSLQTSEERGGWMLLMGGMERGRFQDRSRFSPRLLGAGRPDC